MLYLSCENNKNKQKEGGFGPFFKKNRFVVGITKNSFRSTPPLSLVSSSTATTTTTNSLSAPLQPDPSLTTTTPKRPNRFLGFFPLSPITSSPELSPSSSSPPLRQKQLHLPHILSRLVPSGSLTSLYKVRVFQFTYYLIIFLRFHKFELNCFATYK